MKLYLYLFHGRTNPKEDLNNWGSDGPWVGPFEAITWTYGNLKFHFADGDFEFLSAKVVEDLVHHEGVFYGDFEIFDTLPKGDGEFNKIVSPEKFFNR